MQSFVIGSQLLHENPFGLHLALQETISFLSLYPGYCPSLQEVQITCLPDA